MVLPASRRALVRLGVTALALLSSVPHAAGQNAGDPVESLAAADVSTDVKNKQLIVELPAIEVPPLGMVRTPVYRVEVPFGMSLHRFSARVTDAAGRPVPRDRLHHVIMTDLARRDLFQPVALPIFGASKESPEPTFPAYLLGVPLPAGSRYIMAAMLANPNTEPDTLRVSMVFSYIKPGLLRPIFTAYPWTMDVTFPLGAEGGRHDFDVPPGRSSRSWEGSPAIPGRVLAIGGHAHDYATSLTLEDVTAGDTIWHQVPIRDAEGRILSIPVKRFYRWNRLGVHMEPSHVYRISVEYDNPTGRTLRNGGMGSLVGLLIPDRGVHWPSLPSDDPIYQTQVSNLLNNMQGVETGAPDQHH